MQIDNDILISFYEEMNELNRLQVIKTWKQMHEKIKRNPSLFLGFSRLEAMLKKWISEESKYDSDWPLEENELLPFVLFVNLQFKRHPKPYQIWIQTIFQVSGTLANIPKTQNPTSQ